MTKPYFWLGEAAEVASDQAASRLAPTGFDPLRDLELAAFYIGTDGASLDIEDCDRICWTLKSIRRGLKHMGFA